MIDMPGKNDFKGFFDFFEWSAPVYEGAQEILESFFDMRIIGKKIKDIRVIGAANRLSEEALKLNIFYELSKHGVPRENPIFKQDNYDDFQIKNQVSVNEPMVIEFINGSTFEFLPLPFERVRQSIGTVPDNIQDGMNWSNFIFADAMGLSFLDSEIIDFKIYENVESQNYNEISSYDKKYRKHKNYKQIDNIYSFEFRNKKSESNFCLNLTSYRRRKWYTIGVHGRSWYQPNRISLSDKLKGRKELSQMLLCTGNIGACFTFNLSHDEKQEGFIRLLSEKGLVISVYEEEFATFLVDFFVKHYNPTYQHESECGSGDKFEYYGENLYSFKDMRLIISDIRNTSTNIRNGSSSVIEEEYKKYLKYYKNDIDFYESLSDMNRMYEEFLPIVSDYYERFCRRMESFMEKAGSGMIEVVGP